VLKIGARFFEGGDSIILRGRAEPKPTELRKDEPHPVALLRPADELGERGLINAVLGIDEALEIVGIAHAAIMSL
jgi:hypothetical protein